MCYYCADQGVWVCPGSEGDCGPTVLAQGPQWQPYATQRLAKDQTYWVGMRPLKGNKAEVYVATVAPGADWENGCTMTAMKDGEHKVEYRVRGNKLEVKITPS